MISALQVKVSGYAASGGGRGIERVDVSVDGGKTWIDASRCQKSGIPYIADDDDNSDKWAWVLFEVTVDIQQSTEIIAKAVCDVSLSLLLSFVFLTSCLH
jgi:sulfite oxidase